MVAQDTRVIDLTAGELQILFAETIRSYASSQKSEKNIPDLGGIEIAEEVTGWKKATIYAKVHFHKIPHLKKGGKLFFSRKELLKWLEEGRRKTANEN